jgi:hypothetical protein
MNQIIVYEQDNGIIAIVRPTFEALSMFDIDEIAKKDVPNGKQYFVVDADSLPSHNTRKNWVIRDGKVIEK